MRNFAKHAVFALIALSAASAQANPAVEVVVGAARVLTELTVPVLGTTVAVAQYVQSGQLCPQLMKAISSTNSPSAFDVQAAVGSVCGNDKYLGEHAR